jgi:hypothetical protein
MNILQTQDNSEYAKMSSRNNKQKITEYSINIFKLYGKATNMDNSHKFDARKNLLNKV